MLQAVSIALLLLTAGASSRNVVSLEKRVSPTIVKQVDVTSNGYFSQIYILPPSTFSYTARLSGWDGTLEGCEKIALAARKTQWAVTATGCYNGEIDTSLSTIAARAAIPESRCLGACPGNGAQACGSGECLLWYRYAGGSLVLPSPTVSSATPIPTAADVDPTTKLTSAEWAYSGCYSDDGNPRTLLNFVNAGNGGWTVAKCLAAVKLAGYSIGGVEYGGECWGANSILARATQLPSSSCGMRCNDDSSFSCGGSNAVDVYRAT